MTSTLLEIILPLVMYVCIFISGFIVSIAIGITQSNLDSACQLYLGFKDGSGSSLYLIPSGSGNCNYVIYLSVVAFILYGVVMIALYFYAFYRVFIGREEPMQYIKKVIELAFNVVIWILAFVAACIISVGRSTTCSNYLGVFPKHDSCYDMEVSISSTSRTYDQSIHRTVLAEVTMWVSLIWWTILIVPSAYNLFKRRTMSKS